MALRVGVGTLIGQPPNPLVAACLEDNVNVNVNVTIGFGQRMLFGRPFAFAFLTATWLALTKLVFPAESNEIPGGKEMFQRS